MITAQCMLANTGKCICQEEDIEEIFFEDEKKRRFFSRNYCKYCYNVIYQEKPMALGQQQWKNKLPVQCVRYEFVNETPEQIKEILWGNRVTSFHEGHWALGIE